VEGTDRHADYFRRSTAFVFAEYLGWVEIFRRDLQFIGLGDSKANRHTMSLLVTIGETLNAASTSETECFRIFRADQRALGEIMIDPDSKPGERRCLGYATFCSMLSFELAAREPDRPQDRLTCLQHQLMDLIDFLDPAGQRFPSKQRSRFTSEGKATGTESCGATVGS
jgi:hypothetical protein